MEQRKSGASKDKKKERGSRRSSGESVESYEGERTKDGKREGRGVCKFASGESYEGEWKANKMEGHGTLRMADGDVYDGCFKAGLKDGPGTHYYGSGRADILKYSAGEEGEEGVRFSPDRQMAWMLRKGDVVDEITLEEAQEVAARIGEPIPPVSSDPASPLVRVTGGGSPVDGFKLTAE